MSSALEQLVRASSLDGELDLVFDPEHLPDFIVTDLSRGDVAAALGPLVGHALKAQAEFLGSMPLINAARERHLDKAEASHQQAQQEHEASLEATLQPSPRGAALEQVRTNELASSGQLQSTAHGLVIDIGTAFNQLNEGMDVLDRLAPLVLTEEDEPTNWSFLARGVVNHYLEPAEA